MSSPTVVKLFYGDYNKCKSILRRYKNDNNVHLMLHSKSDKFYDLELFENIKQLTVECNIKVIHPKSKTDQLVYLNISRQFPPLPSMKSLTKLYCDNTNIELIPTFTNLVYLKTNCVTNIQPQPSLEELDIGYNCNLEKLPNTPMLITLICNDTKIVELPSYTKLEFLLCFDTNISTIPSSVCETLKYCFTELKPIFQSKPANLLESFSCVEDVHYGVENNYQLLTKDGIPLLHNISALIERS